VAAHGRPQCNRSLPTIFDAAGTADPAGLGAEAELALRTRVSPRVGVGGICHRNFARKIFFGLRIQGRGPGYYNSSEVVRAYKYLGNCPKT